jgi:hypothetical protein
LEQFEYTLDRALEDKHEIIVIEPTQLGKDTENWIAFGNCLQNTSILSGFGSVLSGSPNFLILLAFSCTMDV